jgi:hypothetical protein
MYTCDDDCTSGMVPYLLPVTLVWKTQVNGTITTGESTILCLAVDSNWGSLDTKFLQELQYTVRIYSYGYIYNKQRIVQIEPSRWSQLNHAWCVPLHRIQRTRHRLDYQWSKH